MVTDATDRAEYTKYGSVELNHMATIRICRQCTCFYALERYTVMFSVRDEVDASKH